MFEPENVLEGPIKQSIESVFNTINSKAEGLDLLKKYRNANKSYVRALVENVQILGMSEPVKLIDIYSITQVSTTINRRLYNVDWENINSVTKTQSLVPSRKLKTNLRADDYIEKNNRIVVLAGPGAGKTTLLKYTALSYIDDEVFETSKLETKKYLFLLPFRI